MYKGSDIFLAAFGKVLCLYYTVDWRDNILLVIGKKKEKFFWEKVDLSEINLNFEKEEGGRAGGGEGGECQQYLYD